MVPILYPASLLFFFPPQTFSFLLPHRFFFKPIRASCVDLQGQMISWKTLVLISLIFHDRIEQPGQLLDLAQLLGAALLCQNYAT